jgi:hypothetical protein
METNSEYTSAKANGETKGDWNGETVKGRKNHGNLFDTEKISIIVPYTEYEHN